MASFFKEQVPEELAKSGKTLEGCKIRFLAPAGINVLPSILDKNC